jgi:hypothetical protein
MRQRVYAEEAHVVRASFNDAGCADGAEAFRSGRRLEQPEPGQCCDAVIETDLLDNLAVHDLEHRGLGAKVCDATPSFSGVGVCRIAPEFRLRGLAG